MFIILFAFFFTDLQAQSLHIIVDVDTITSEKVFEVSYVLDQSCRPDDMHFDNFDVIYGPNVSKSVSIMNGKRTAETKLTFGLQAVQEGEFILPNEMCGTVVKKAPMITVINGYETKDQRLEKIKSTRTIKKILCVIYFVFLSLYRFS